MSARIGSATALVVAGGTGGHIFPGLAVAKALAQAGWNVQWLGGRGEPGNPSMESRLVLGQGIKFEGVNFSGVRGKGIVSFLRLPLALAKAIVQSWSVFNRVKPDLVLGFGGYVTFPAGLLAALLRKPLVLHEQNSVAGMANRQLARFARKIFTAFPKVMANSEWTGNPLRSEFLNKPEPATRFEGRDGPLRILVLGGSLGATALNDVVPKALSLFQTEHRPVVTHQSGQKQIAHLRANYLAAGVEANLTPFIDDVAQAMADADLLVCRSGASTVTELAAIGVTAVFVPFPAAADDHQTFNARFLADHGAAVLLPQSQLSPESLAALLKSKSRADCLEMAIAAKRFQKTGATEYIVQACGELVGLEQAA